MTNHAVWDLPSRFIHWCFPVGVGLMWWTGETGRMELHSYIAYVLLTLVVTRLALEMTKGAPVILSAKLT